MAPTPSQAWSTSLVGATHPVRDLGARPDVLSFVPEPREAALFSGAAPDYALVTSAKTRPSLLMQAFEEMVINYFRQSPFRPTSATILSTGEP